MRQIAIALAAIAIFDVAGAALAQSDQQTYAVKDVVGSQSDADGSHTLTFSLADGKRLSLNIPTEAGIKAISALSAPTGTGPTKKQVVVVVPQFAVGVDDKGANLVLVPIRNGSTLEPLGIPVSGAENFIRVLQQKLGEARTKAASQPK